MIWASESVQERWIKSIRSWPTPDSVGSLQSFLGFVKVYHIFIRRYSTVVGPKLELLKRDKKFIRNKNCQSSLEQLKT
jgi:hypothetical protein